MSSLSQRIESGTIVASSPYRPQRVADTQFDINLAGARLPRAVVSSWLHRSPTEISLDRSEVERLLRTARDQEAPSTMLHGALVQLRNSEHNRVCGRNNKIVLLAQVIALGCEVIASRSGHAVLSSCLDLAFTMGWVAIPGNFLRLLRQVSAPLAPLKHFRTAALMNGYYWLDVKSKPELAAVEFGAASREQLEISHTARAFFGLLRCASSAKDRASFFIALQTICDGLAARSDGWRASNQLTGIVVDQAIALIVEKIESTRNDRPARGAADHPYINGEAFKLIEKLLECTRGERPRIASGLLAKFTEIEFGLLEKHPHVREPLRELLYLCVFTQLEAAAVAQRRR